MELLTLDSNYQPANLIEKYGSLIWTERYASCGDFQLITNDISRFVKLLPLESTVTLRESTVPMVVEAHKIEKKPPGAPVLTIVGRSFESVLDRRVTVKLGHDLGPKVAWTESQKKEADAAYQAIFQTIGQGLYPPMNSSNDALSMINLIVPADYGITGAPAPYNIDIKPGNLYSVVMELLAANHHGLKAIRPDSISNQIGIEIYNGADLTNDVVFDAKYDQFDDTTYFLSYTGSANTAYVISPTASQPVHKNTGLEPSGLDRRVLYLDVSSDGTVDNSDARYTRGLIELYKYNATALFDGHIAEQVAAGYNRDYFLGDIIRLDGEYGLSENVRVSEFIRSEDSTGVKAYPTFEVVS